MSPGSLTKKQYYDLHLSRLDEGRSLYEAGRWHGAIYVSGYAVEFLLKAIICNRQPPNAYPVKDGHRYYTHDLGLLAQLAAMVEKSGTLKTSPGQIRTPLDIKELGANWIVVSAWSEELRYENTKSEQDAIEFFHALNSPRTGVIPWLLEHL